MPKTEELFRAKNTPGPPQKDVLLSGPDSAITNRDVPRMACFPYVLPEAKLRASLGLALQEVPVLTGRLVSGEDNRTYLRCNDTGLLLVVEYNDAPMPDYGYQNSPKKHIDRYIARLSSNKIDRDKPLVSVQINYFRDGMIIGFSNDHSVMDGNMAWEFLNRWGDYTREPQQPAKAYCLDRVQSRRFDRVEPTEPATSYARLSHLSKWGKLRFYAGLFLGRFRLATVQLHFSEQRLSELKEEVSSQLPDGEWISTLDIPAGLLLHWFSICCTEKSFTAHTMYNLRSIPGSHFPANYVGNANIARSCTLPTRDESITLARCAREIRKLASAISLEDVQRDMAYMNYMYDRDETHSLYAQAVLAQGTANGYLVNNYARFPTYGIDFGSGRPSWCDYPPVAFPHYALILPDPNDDGVRVQITLPKREMQTVLDLPKDIRHFETAFSA